ncbi:MAG: CYTH domain-containing protein [Muribaculaceae bacterium]|nr:CYTH domain-containing protein [Muribaculaceae bacterium]
MGKEIERKFLVTDFDAVKTLARDSVRISQGYLSVAPERTVRVRLRGNRAFLTIKGITCGASRAEYEYEIPEADARELLGLCEGKIIDKTRYLVDFEGHTWEVDEFHSPRRLWVAEAELNSESEELILPPWVGQEVTGNPEYYNSSIAK